MGLLVSALGNLPRSIRDGQSGFNQGAAALGELVFDLGDPPHDVFGVRDRDEPFEAALVPASPPSPRIEDPPEPFVYRRIGIAENDIADGAVHQRNADLRDRRSSIAVSVGRSAPETIRAL